MAVPPFDGRSFRPWFMLASRVPRSFGGAAGSAVATGQRGARDGCGSLEAPLHSVVACVESLSVPTLKITPCAAVIQYNCLSKTEDNDIR